MSEPIKVMIVDDHTLFRQGLRKVLETYREIQVIGEASDGKEAIVRVGELQPDVVLMDIKMPRMEGFESTRLIRESYPELVIIALTMYEDADYVVKMVHAGANGYMHKDISVDKLVDAIRHMHEGVVPPFYLAVGAETLREVVPTGVRGKELSRQEKQTLKLMTEGNSNKEIAAKLSLSDQTIKGYVRSIFQKLGASSRAQAVAIALNKSLIE
jgi:two-component system nitrate/nitrite response regulator NarL